MLLTLDDLEDRRRYLNAASTLDRLLTLRAVPVINENDSVATAEIRFGDNDRLAARVAQAASAQAVLLLSDVDGLYTANPHRDPQAQRVPEVRRIDARIRAMADGGSSSGMGSGGMTSKIEAARIAQAVGAHLVIARGDVLHPLRSYLAGDGGTIFVGDTRPGGARKAWLAGRLTARGRVSVDAGAATALARGASLLAAGATQSRGASPAATSSTSSDRTGDRPRSGRI
jgi:glutamate 5-kinase